MLREYIWVGITTSSHFTILAQPTQFWTASAVGTLLSTEQIHFEGRGKSERAWKQNPKHSMWTQGRWCCYGWRKFHKKEMNCLYSSNIGGIIKQRRWRLSAFVAVTRVARISSILSCLCTSHVNKTIIYKFL